MSTDGHYAEIIAALKAYPDLVALVGDRIRVDFAETTDAVPFIVVKSGGGEIVRGLDDSRHAELETYEIEHWGERRAQARQVAHESLLALELAGFAPETKQPDGIDPELWDRVTVYSVEIWTT